MAVGIIVPLVAALIAAIGAYFAAVRKLSGTITTSTAEDLWAESRQMRRELTQRVAQLTNLVDTMQKRIDDLTQENESLREQMSGLTKRVEDGES